MIIQSKAHFMVTNQVYSVEPTRSVWVCFCVCDLMDFGYATDKCKQYIKTVPYVIVPVALGFYAVLWVICY